MSELCRELVPPDPEPVAAHLGNHFPHRKDSFFGNIDVRRPYREFRDQEVLCLEVIEDSQILWLTIVSHLAEETQHLVKEHESYEPIG